jgi:hypothetical protein
VRSSQELGTAKRAVLVADERTAGRAPDVQASAAFQAIAATLLGLLAAGAG